MADKTLGYPGTSWLTVSVPLPWFLDDPQHKRLKQLDHRGYSVVFDPGRYLCRMAAGGIPAATEADAAVWHHAKKKPYPPAHLLSARRQDPPFVDDPDLPDASQTGDDWYSHFSHLFDPPRAFDRGHMMPRSHLEFGPCEEAATESGKQTFLYTNAVPQTQPFNEWSSNPQTTAGWRYVEDFIEKLSALGARILEFTGPIFDDELDPTLDAPEPIRPARLQIPRCFWKILAIERAADPEKRFCYPFILDDSKAVAILVDRIQRAPEPGIVPEPLPELPTPKLKWRTLDEISNATKLDVSELRRRFPVPTSHGQTVTSTMELLAAVPA